jgi:hypothetical protein
MESPYLTPNRLADLIAAIQVMATYDQYRGSPDDWSYRISGTKDAGPKWKNVFENHAEFFRKSPDRNQYALAWRRALPSRYDRRVRALVTDEQYYGMSVDDRKEYISRPPLPDAQIKTLIDVATSLHARATEQSRDWRWWVQPLLGFIAAFIGASAAFYAALLRSGGPPSH